jgi:hypothetical protein
MSTIEQKVEELKKNNEVLYDEFLRLQEVEAQAMKQKIESHLETLSSSYPKDNANYVYLKNDDMTDSEFQKPIKDLLADWDDIRFLHVLEAIESNNMDELKKLGAFIHFGENSRWGRSNFALYYALETENTTAVSTLIDLGIGKELFFEGEALNIAFKKKNPKLAETLILKDFELGYDYDALTDGGDEINAFEQTIPKISDKGLKTLTLTLTEQGYPLGKKKDGRSLSHSLSSVLEAELNKRGIGLKDTTTMPPIQFYSLPKASKSSKKSKKIEDLGM